MADNDRRPGFRERYIAPNERERDELNAFLGSGKGTFIVWGCALLVAGGIVWAIVSAL